MTIDYTDPTTLDSDTLAGWEALGPNGRAAIVSQAKADAALFAEEWPGETIDGDWDATAWETSRGEIATTVGRGLLDAAADAAGHDVAWGLYHQSLHAEVARLVAG